MPAKALKVTLKAVAFATFMLFAANAFSQSHDASPDINTLELRNYVLKPGQRDRFINYFAAHFVQSQVDLGGYPLKWCRVKGQPDNFCWMRGFADMASRSRFLPAFYYGPVWKQYGPEANSMLANNDNVYLLKPLTLTDGTLQSGKPISSGLLKNGKGIAVVDFYIANTKLDKLLAAFAKYYVPAFKAAAINNYTLWVSETQKNDFPRLPVFQDANLLVAITFYKDERQYRQKQKAISSSMAAAVKDELQDIITTKNSLIVYPAN